VWHDGYNLRCVEHAKFVITECGNAQCLCWSYTPIPTLTDFQKATDSNLGHKLIFQNDDLRGILPSPKITVCLCSNIKFHVDYTTKIDLEVSTLAD
jgi:hypothetical protein